MAALWAAPAEHVHPSPDGPSVVHRHLIDDTARHANPTFDHDDHSTATTIDPVYVPEQPFADPQPLSAARTLPGGPERRFVGRAAPGPLPIAHSPPLRIGSLRAPPA